MVFDILASMSFFKNILKLFMFPFLFISTQNFNSLFFVYLLRAPYHSERTRVTKYLLSCVVVRASLLGSESFDPLAIAQPEVWDRRATIDRAPPRYVTRAIR